MREGGLLGWSTDALIRLDDEVPGVVSRALTAAPARRQAIFAALAAAELKAGVFDSGPDLLPRSLAEGAGEAGFLPRGFGTAATPGRLPPSNPLINGAIMALLVVMTSQPTLAGQFALLIGACTVLTICLYALCCISLFRFSRSVGWRALAAVGLVFSVGAVVAAAPGNVLPAIVLFAVASVGWFWVRRSPERRVDARGEAL